MHKVAADSDLKYMNVRRLLIFIDASIDQDLKWAVFRPNALDLSRRNDMDFLTLAGRSGALAGTRVEEAYFVKCDRGTMSQLDTDNGRLICVIGIAPVEPPEFAIIRIASWTYEPMLSAR
jgi:phage tail sheath protein FI